MGKLKSFRPSFRLVLTVLFFLIGIIPVSWIGLLSYNAYSADRYAKMRNDSKRVAESLADRIDEREYFKNEEQKYLVEEVLRELSSLYHVQSFLVNQSYRIVYETVESSGVFMPLPGVIKALGDGKMQGYETEDGSYLTAVPIGKTEQSRADGVLVILFPLRDVSAGIEEYGQKILGGWFLALALTAFMAPLLSWITLKPFKHMLFNLRKGNPGGENDGIYKEEKQISELFADMTERLSEIDQSRDEFVQNVSHELKTPITSVKILADSLRQMEDVPVEMYKEFLDDISSEIDRESAIIADLLMLVKMDKRASLNIQKVNMNQMLEGILKRLAPIAKKSEVDLTLESIREVSADVDEGKLSLAIMNVVENAIKYNFPGGWVRVNLNADHKNFTILVADSGAGIPKKAISQIFERFYRVDKARSRSIGGTGLGLAITKGIVELHNGSIEVESSSEEDLDEQEHLEQDVLENADVSVTGTVFTICIPLTYIAPKENTIKKGENTQKAKRNRRGKQV